jgi:hypothetical protein
MKAKAKRWPDEQESHEAGRGDEKANSFKVRYLHGTSFCICGGHKRESGCALPGEVWMSAIKAIPVARRGEGQPEVSRGHSSAIDHA